MFRKADFAKRFFLTEFILRIWFWFDFWKWFVDAFKFLQIREMKRSWLVVSVQLLLIVAVDSRASSFERHQHTTITSATPPAGSLVMELRSCSATSLGFVVTSREKNTVEVNIFVFINLWRFLFQKFKNYGRYLNSCQEKCALENWP